MLTNKFFMLNQFIEIFIVHLATVKCQFCCICLVYFIVLFVQVLFWWSGRKGLKALTLPDK